MVFRLDTVLGNTKNLDYVDIANRVGVDSSDMYDLLCCQYNTGDSLQFGDYTFDYTRTVKKVIDHYCEGKCNYHYDIKLTDKNSGDMYNVTCNFYNDDIQSIAIAYVGNKKVEEKKCCANPHHVVVTANNMPHVEVKTVSNTYDHLPQYLRIGEGRSLKLTFCSNCNKIIKD